MELREQDFQHVTLLHQTDPVPEFYNVSTQQAFEVVHAMNQFATNDDSPYNAVRDYGIPFTVLAAAMMRSAAVYWGTDKDDKDNITRVADQFVWALIRDDAKHVSFCSSGSDTDMPTEYARVDNIDMFTHVRFDDNSETSHFGKLLYNYTKSLAEGTHLQDGNVAIESADPWKTSVKSPARLRRRIERLRAQLLEQSTPDTSSSPQDLETQINEKLKHVHWNAQGAAYMHFLTGTVLCLLETYYYATQTGEHIVPHPPLSLGSNSRIMMDNMLRYIMYAWKFARGITTTQKYQMDQCIAFYLAYLPFRLREAHNHGYVDRLYAWWTTPNYTTDLPYYTRHVRERYLGVTLEAPPRGKKRRPKHFLWSNATQPNDPTPTDDSSHALNSQEPSWMQASWNYVRSLGTGTT
jgi:hypothetical protein